MGNAPSNAGDGTAGSEKMSCVEAFGVACFQPSPHAVEDDDHDKTSDAVFEK